MLAALGFYTSGSFQTSMGDTIGISQASMSRCVSNVTRALVEKAPQFITFNRYNTMPLMEITGVTSCSSIFKTVRQGRNIAITEIMFPKQRSRQQRAVLPGVPEGGGIPRSSGGARLCSGSYYYKLLTIIFEGSV